MLHWYLAHWGHLLTLLGILLAWGLVNAALRRRQVARRTSPLLSKRALDAPAAPAGRGDHPAQPRN